MYFSLCENMVWRERAMTCHTQQRNKGGGSLRRVNLEFNKKCINTITLIKTLLKNISFAPLVEPILFQF